MAAPVVTITHKSRTKISDEFGADRSVVRFTADQDLIDYEARAGGIGKGTGLLVGDSGVLTASESLYVNADLLMVGFNLPVGQEGEFAVDNEELQNDGDYRISVYGCNEAGEWSAYE